jgi:fibronectin-binding autotransporter adhesin
MIRQHPAIRQTGLERMAAAARPGTATRMRAVVAVAIAAAFVFTLSAATANATIYRVNTLDDSSGNRDCSLRDAINAANGTPTSGSTCTRAGSGRDTIWFSVTGTVQLGGTLPQVTDRGLTINGPASPRITIDGGGSVQVMQVASGATLNLQNLPITRGYDNDVGGGGIENFGTLTVTNSTFSSNSADQGGLGGGIYNQGTLTVTNSTFSGNSANADGEGGGIFNSNMLTVTNSTFSGNSGIAGDGIYNQGTLIVTNSTFSGNSGDSSGSGIFNDRTLTVTNSTFSGNNAAQGGSILNFSGSASLKGTILAASSGGNCSGGITDAGYNISDDSTCGFARTGSANNGDGVDPLLSTAGLANNGGPTQTIALAPGSPAIDTITLADCTDQTSPPNRLITDQRGALRPDAGEVLCDIGAYEVQDLAGQPLCGVKSVLALIRQFGSIEAAVSALGFPNVIALLKAMAISCGG